MHSLDPVNLAYGTNTTLLELIAMIEEQLGHSVEKAFTATRVGDVKASQAQNTRVSQLFPDVEPATLEVGLAATLRWFQSQAGASH